MKFLKILSHINIILSGMFLVFFSIDRVNSAMDFLGNNISKWLLFCFSISAMMLAIIELIIIRKKERNHQKPKNN